MLNTKRFQTRAVAWVFTFLLGFSGCSYHETGKSSLQVNDTDDPIYHYELVVTGAFIAKNPFHPTGSKPVSYRFYTKERYGKIEANNLVFSLYEGGRPITQKNEDRLMKGFINLSSNMAVIDVKLVNLGADGRVESYTDFPMNGSYEIR